jgi:hypothetical protein
MEFIKRHYEKILLCAVLLGLVGALVMMGFIIVADKEKSADIKNGFFGGNPKPLQPLDLTRQTQAIQRLQTPMALDFSTKNKLFNSVQWQMDVNGKRIKITGDNVIGAGAAVVTKISPLFFVVTLDSLETNVQPPGYFVSIESQAAPQPYARRPVKHYVSTVEKSPIVTLDHVTGDPNNPDQLFLKLSDGSMAVVSKDKPFRRVEGYTADLKYDPEGLKWQACRIGADLKFAGDDYNVVAIQQDEVILSAQSNQKRTPLRYVP